MYKISDKVVVNNKEYLILSYLGKGKGGYSFLAECENMHVVLKKIHHEKCDYYTFSDKMQSELNDYKKLLEIGVTVPVLIDFNIADEIIIKQYISGKTLKQLIDDNELKETHIKKIIATAKMCKEKGYNIDYYPTNFICNDDVLYYVDYEINPYEEKWDFDSWGKSFYLK